jgi:hypothetical protein
LQQELLGEATKAGQPERFDAPRRSFVIRRSACHCCPESLLPLVEEGFRLSDQNVRPVHTLLTLLYQTLGSIPNVLPPLPYFRRQRHAAKSMSSHVFSEIGAASWA